MNAVKTIDANTFAADAGCRRHVIDVRSPAEFRARHVPGSVNIPLDEIQAGHVPAIAAGETVTLVCETGKRSGMACELLAQKLAGPVVTIDGGISALANAGVSLQVDKGVWSLERQVRVTAGALVVLGVVLSFWIPAFVFLSGFVGAGLMYAGITDNCGMALVLAKMPWNQ